MVVTAAWYKKYSATYIREQLEKYKQQNNYDFYLQKLTKFLIIFS